MTSEMLSLHNTENAFSLTVTPISAHLLRTDVYVHRSLVSAVHTQTLELYQTQVCQPGFPLFQVPLLYIEKHYQKEVFSCVKGFIFTNFVFSVLIHELMKRKILVADLPRLKRTTIFQNHTLYYSFDVSIAKPIKLKEWKHFVFKSPKRKNYKDLDKQVTLFIKNERSAFRKQNPQTVEDGDWVYFEAELLNSAQQTIKPTFCNNFWIKTSIQHVARPLCKSLIGKNIGTRFISNDLNLTHSFQEKLNNHYSYAITIKSISKGRHLCLDSFKSLFKLKSKASVHKKLIEVFSYRNDLSQRKSIIEEVFHLFFSKHRFEIPKHIILRRKEDILLSLKQQPDYHVYKTQKDFIKNVEILAEKQLKEEILIDQIAYNEDIEIKEKDIQNYLNLFNNERLKEFVYFKPLIERIEDASIPLHENILRQAALREKTLNHVILILTK